MEEVRKKEEIVVKYTSGIPTLRSSSHRVRHSTVKDEKNKNAPKPKRTNSSTDAESNTCNGTLLPLSIRKVEQIQYDFKKYDFKKAIIQFLSTLDSDIVGGFKDTIDDHNIDNILLENFDVPVESLRKKSKRGLLLAQDHLSAAMHNCFFGNNANDRDGDITASIVSTFDNFLTEVIVPHLKSRLINEGVIPSSGTEVNFYYQRPPTLRIQPGPARARVNWHKDKDYGHQDGELNFWIPLTNRHDTGVDLYVESDEDVGDYKPLGTDVGHVSSFFGSGCSHYVNENKSECTRVSLDFRVGIEPFYDPLWSKIGTRDDHLRRSIQM